MSATMTPKMQEVVAVIQAAFETFTSTGSMAGYDALRNLKNFTPAFHSLKQRGIIKAVDTVNGRPVWYATTSK